MTQKERQKRRESMAFAIRDGESLSAVCDKFECTRYTVYDACKEFGVAYGHLLDLPRVWPSTYRVLADLLYTRDTFKDVAARHNISGQRVGDIYRDAIAGGIKLPPRGLPKTKETAP